ncbi:MAG: hypothetical protein H6835_06355 [Planctomycetes bacterium]|nr:hypothetical protein [Planctomycetota bacterium]
MRFASILTGLTLLSSALPSQSITATNTVACDARVTFGGSTQVTTLPVGPLPSVGNLQNALPPYGEARLDWLTYANAAAIGAEIDLTAEASSSLVQAQAAVSDVDFVLQLGNATSRTVILELYQLTSATAGTATPLLRVDVDDDGSDELTEAQQGTTVTSVRQIGPTPLTVRIRASMQVVGDAAAQTHLYLRCYPTDDVFPIALGCTATSYQVQPTFSGDLQLMAAPAWGDPAVAVLGFDVAPVLLPGQRWQVCLLIPTTDVLLLLMPWQPITLPIPAAARPATLYTQTVGLGADFLTTSTAFGVALH